MTTAPAPNSTGPHGGDVIAVATALGLDAASILDLSASLNPFAPDAAEVVAEVAGSVARYPDASVATAALADAMGIDRDRLVLTNGAAEAIALVAAETQAGWVEEPEFSLYARHLEIISPEAGSWRSNPSNPLGTLAPADARAAVWDEAFWPLATGSWTRGDDDVWRIGSLTKLWACPGLRLGYVIGPDSSAARAIAARQPRWSVNALALTSLPRLLAATDLASWSSAIGRQRGILVDELEERGLTVIDTDACWVLVEHRRLRDLLLSERVLVRDCTSFGLTDTARIAVPTDAALGRLLEAVDRTVSR